MSCQSDISSSKLLMRMVESKIFVIHIFLAHFAQMPTSLCNRVLCPRTVSEGFFFFFLGMSCFIKIKLVNRKIPKNYSALLFFGDIDCLRFESNMHVVLHKLC